MIQDVMKLLLAVNRESSKHSGCVTYDIRMIANYDLEKDGIKFTFRLIEHQKKPKKDLETLSFDNAMKIYDHLVNLFKYWKNK